MPIPLIAIIAFNKIDQDGCNALIEVAGEDELPSLMIVIHSEKGSPFAMSLWKLNAELRKLALANLEAKSLEIAH